jgi:hypothetical protein
MSSNSPTSRAADSRTATRRLRSHMDPCVRTDGATRGWVLHSRRTRSLPLRLADAGYRAGGPATRVAFQQPYDRFLIGDQTVLMPVCRAARSTTADVLTAERCRWSARMRVSSSYPVQGSGKPFWWSGIPGGAMGCRWRPMGRRWLGTRAQCCCGGSRTLEPAGSARVLRFNDGSAVTAQTVTLATGGSLRPVWRR